MTLHAFRPAYLLGIRRGRNCLRRLHTMDSPNFFKPLGLNNSTGNSSLTKILTSTSPKRKKNAVVTSYLMEASFSSVTTTNITAQTFSKSKSTNIFRISEEIQEAIEGKAQTPVVALESAILTHGMPYPHNIETSLHLQSMIREKGAIPATIGVINGQLAVGISDEEIEMLGSPKTNITPVVKVSRRDLPYVLSQKLHGGTTVSGTIIGAVKAGISVFATGGIGGVHRGAETTFDISADLRELGRSPIAVVSAGVKSILDIGKTLEYLETEGVCVCVLKRNDEDTLRNSASSNNKESSDLGINTPASITDRAPRTNTAKFPSFFTAESPFDAPFALADETQAAVLIHSALQLKINSGVLIAVPIPKEFEASGHKIEGAIQEALEKASRLSIQGRDMTPFLLGEINQLTQGESLLANKHLIENNVRIATKIATELVKLTRREVEMLQPGSNASESKYGGGNLKKSQSRLLNTTGTNDSPLNPYQKRSLSTMTNQKYRIFFNVEDPQIPPTRDSNSSTSDDQNSRRKKAHTENNGERQECDFLGRKTVTTLTLDCLDEYNLGPVNNALPSLNQFTLQPHSLFKFSKNSRTKGIQGYRNYSTGRPVVIGGTSLDLILSVKEKQIVTDGRTHNAKIETTPGGVGRNMAEALGKLGHSPILISAVGDDLFGREVLRQLELSGMDSSGVFTSSHNPTAIYSAVLNHKGECIFGLGDMTVHSELTPSTILQKQHHHYHHIRSAPIVVLDGNIPVETMAKVLEICMQNKVPVWFEPTEVRKAKKILEVPREFWGGLSYISPNLVELKSIMDEISGSRLCADISSGDTFTRSEDNLLSVDIRLHSMVSHCFAMFTGLRLILFTKGKDGFMVLSRKNGSEENKYEVSSFPPPAVTQDKIVSVSGAGDCLNAGFISGVLQGCTITESAVRGTHCAQESLQCTRNVPDAFRFLM